MYQKPHNDQRRRGQRGDAGRAPDDPAPVIRRRIQRLHRRAADIAVRTDVRLRRTVAGVCPIVILQNIRPPAGAPLRALLYGVVDPKIRRGAASK